jgi:hypothetical protein
LVDAFHYHVLGTAGRLALILLENLIQYPNNPPLNIVGKAVHHGLALVGGYFVLEKLPNGNIQGFSKVTECPRLGKIVPPFDIGYEGYRNSGFFG